MIAFPLAPSPLLWWWLAYISYAFIRPFHFQMKLNVTSYQEDGPAAAFGYASDDREVEGG